MTLPRFDALTWPLTGRWLIEASAGTGKTWTLAQLYVRLVVEQNRPVEQLLVITYTDAAAAELRDRLRGRLAEALAAVERCAAGLVVEDSALATLVEAWGEGLPDRPMDDPLHLASQRLAAAVQGFDRAAISTIHGFCARALQEHAFESGAGFDPELSAAGDDVVDRVVHDLWTAALHDAEPAYVAWVTDRLWPGVARRVVQLGVAPQPPRPCPAAPPAGVADARRWQAAVEAFRPAWHEGRATALKLGPGLNQTSYKPARVEEMVATVDEWLSAVPVIPPPDKKKKLIQALSAESLRDGTKKGHQPPRHPVFTALSELLAAGRDTVAAWTVAETALQHRLLTTARAALDRARPTANTLYFDDLLVRLDAALAGAGTLGAALRARYPVVMVDEYQDTDPVQTRIVEAIHPDDAGTLFLVGDPKQAIYGFRGADLDTYVGAARRLHDRTASLGRSFRSDGPLIDALAALYDNNPAAFRSPDIRWEPIEAHHAAARVRGPGAPLQLLFVPRDKDDKVALEIAIAEDVARALTAGWEVRDGEAWRPVRPGDMAVLVSKHRTGSAIAGALGERGVPAVRRGGDEVMQTPEARAMLTLLDAMLAPSDVSRLKALRLSPLVGDDAALIAELDEKEGALQRALDDVARWRTLWDHRGFYRAFRAMLREQNVAGKLLRLRGGERTLTNVRHLAELLHTAESASRLGPLELRRWLARELDPARKGREGRELRLESDDLAVQVVTMHTSKGLEYPIVWVAELHDPPREEEPPVFHEDGRRVVDLGSPDLEAHAADALREGREERARLAYVALTRARHVCIAAWGRFHGRGNKAVWREGPLAGLLRVDTEAKDDPALWAATQRRIEATSGLELRMAVGTLTRWEPPDDGALPRPARYPARHMSYDQRITSFTGLIAAAPPDDDGQDTDALVRHAPPMDAPSELPLVAFPRGAEAGTIVHAVLEQLDFADPLGDAAWEVITAELDRGGIPLDPHALVLRHGLAEALATELDPGFCLADLDRADRIDEMGFMLAAGEVTGGALADELERHEPVLGPRYAPRLRRLDIRLMRAALKGYIDLVYRRGGRWYVVDHKTNHLGGMPDDYTPERLLQQMIESDYLLQAALYTVAVHRFLRVRLPGYDYDRHMGGVRYLFLRGMRPQTGATRGVYAFRPSRGWIEGWDRLLGGPRRGGG